MNTNDVYSIYNILENNKYYNDCLLFTVEIIKRNKTNILYCLEENGKIFHNNNYFDYLPIYMSTSVIYGDIEFIEYFFFQQLLKHGKWEISYIAERSLVDILDKITTTNYTNFIHYIQLIKDYNIEINPTNFLCKLSSIDSVMLCFELFDFSKVDVTKKYTHYRGRAISDFLMEMSCSGKCIINFNE